MALITRDEAIGHLRITLGAWTPAIVTQDLDAKIVQAEDIIINYLKQPDPTWTETTVPPRVKVAILWMLAHLYLGERGDSMDKTKNDAAVWEAIDRLLKRSRDPALA